MKQSLFDIIKSYGFSAEQKQGFVEITRPNNTKFGCANLSQAIVEIEKELKK